mmetsp:Transcript_106836/g.297425  ORF Transcript_106836/g.297425 Transcript_106836/m.297425 type:complete len:209 (-) Transcript_106836:78-704(-)
MAGEEGHPQAADFADAISAQEVQTVAQSLAPWRRLQQHRTRIDEKALEWRLLLTPQVGGGAVLGAAGLRQEGAHAEQRVEGPDLAVLRLRRREELREVSTGVAADQHLPGARGLRQRGRLAALLLRRLASLLLKDALPHPLFLLLNRGLLGAAVLLIEGRGVGFSVKPLLTLLEKALMVLLGNPLFLQRLLPCILLSTDVPPLGHLLC